MFHLNFVLLPFCQTRFKLELWRMQGFLTILITFCILYKVLCPISNLNYGPIIEGGRSVTKDVDIYFGSKFIKLWDELSYFKSWKGSLKQYKRMLLKINHGSKDKIYMVERLDIRFKGKMRKTNFLFIIACMEYNSGAAHNPKGGWCEKNDILSLFCSSFR